MGGTRDPLTPTLERSLGLGWLSRKGQWAEAAQDAEPGSAQETPERVRGKHGSGGRAPLGPHSRPICPVPRAALGWACACLSLRISPEPARRAKPRAP